MPGKMDETAENVPNFTRQFQGGVLNTVLFLFKRFFLICLQKILYGPSLN
jgi:hypothetical protein